MRRTDQRREAVFALYQHDVTGRPVEEVLGADARPFTRALVRSVLDHRGELDDLIAGHSVGWSLERIAPLERSILRVALAEMLHADELPADRSIPVEVAIDEAVETTKTFCGTDAPGFVNGVLGAALRSVRQNPAPQ